MRDLDDAMKSPRMGGYFQGDVHDPHRSVHIVQRHLDAFAREREAAVWQEAANWMEEGIFDLTATAHNAVGVIRRMRDQATKKFRARAAEARGKE